MLFLLAVSGLVLFLTIQSGNPANWRWLAWDAPAAVDNNARDAATAPIDAKPAADFEHFFPGVDPTRLDQVRDDTVFRPQESDAWFHLLGILARADDTPLAAGSLGQVGYLQLDQQPGQYRGRLITIGGIVRQAKRVTAPANDEGIDHYFQVWLQPDRTSPALVVLYCLRLPEGFPIGSGLDTAATATGFFFKRWAYPSQGGIATAPLLLARTVDLQAPVPERPQEARPQSQEVLSAVVGALVLAAFTLAFLVWRGRGGRRRSPTNHDHVARALKSLESQDVDEPGLSRSVRGPSDE